MEELHVDARRDLVHAVDVADDLFEDVPDVLGPDDDRCCRGERLTPPRRQLGVPAHGVLQLRAVRLHRERHADGGADRRTEQHVVGEDQVGGKMLAHGRGVQPDVALALRSAEGLQQLRLEPFVTVEHEDGQQPADVRPHHARAADVVCLRLRLLAEDDDVVSCAAPLARERTRVDVRSRPAEQVAVPEQDAHPARRYVK